MTEAMPSFSRDAHTNLVAASERTALLADPGFGRVFTDHMVTIRYTAAQGWHDARVHPRVPLAVDPACAVFHYAQEIFEGLKAYKLDDGGVALFRAERNAERFRHSAERLAMAPLPDALFVEACRQITSADRDWIPTAEGGALYLRPFMIASGNYLGVKPSDEYLFMVIASSVGNYFKGGARAVDLWISRDFTRAAPGGTGAAKCGGNYAASLAAQAEAIAQGCDQVVFLDAAERRWVEELGGMNIFFVMADGTLVTPPLTGTILPGITRASLIQLAQDMGLTVAERAYAIDDWAADAADGRLCEAFACGTAAVVTSIGRVRGDRHDFRVGDGGIGPVATRLRDALVNIQRGRADDPRGWLERLF